MMLLLGGVCMLPLTGQSNGKVDAAVGGVRVAPSARMRLAPVAIAPVAPRRDPFRAPDSDASTAVGGLVLPENAGGDAPAFGLAHGALAVRAVVLGREPRALVEIDGHVAVVRVGTRLAGAMITGIDAHGLTLAGGRRVALDEAAR